MYRGFNYIYRIIFKEAACGVKEAAQSMHRRLLWITFLILIIKTDHITAWKEDSRQPQKCIRWQKLYKKIPTPEPLF